MTEIIATTKGAAPGAAMVPADPGELRLTVNAALSEQVQVDLDPVLIRLAIPEEWFAPSLRAPLPAQ
jgi:hypothetical protein